MAKVTMIAALDYRGAIGKSGVIPWKLRDDMSHFQDTTTGQIVVMGRKTYESLPPRFRPLPNRMNWVLSKDPTFHPQGCTVMRGVLEVLLQAGDREIFVIGGEEIYRLFLPFATKLILTHVKTEVEEADAFFTEISTNWSQTLLSKKEADSRNQFAFSIVEYCKIL